MWDPPRRGVHPYGESTPRPPALGPGGRKKEGRTAAGLPGAEVREGRAGVRAAPALPGGGVGGFLLVVSRLSPSPPTPLPRGERGGRIWLRAPAASGRP